MERFILNKSICAWVLVPASFLGETLQTVERNDGSHVVTLADMGLPSELNSTETSALVFLTTLPSYGISLAHLEKMHALLDSHGYGSDTWLDVSGYRLKKREKEWEG